MLRILIFIIILIFSSYVFFLAFFSSSELPTETKHGNFMPYLADKPISEDGFYMLTVAWNYGEGKGFSYNQGLKTSGVQPLSTIVFGILAYASNKVGITKKEFPRIIILFSALVLFFFTLELKSILLSFFKEHDENVVFFLCILFGLLNFDLFVSFTNGLETGLYLLLILISIRIYWKLINETNRRNILDAGAIFGIAALARIDFIIISVVLLILGLFYSKIKIKAAFTILILQFLIISPWLIYTYNLTGHIIQSSAISQISYLNPANFGNRLYQMLLAFFQITTLNIYTGQQDLILLLLGSLVSIFIFLGYFKNRKVYKEKSFIYLSIFSAFTVLMFSYAILSHATYFYFRYFSPMTVLILLSIIPIIYESIKGFSLKKYSMIGLLFTFIFMAHAYLYFHSGKLGVHMSLRPAFIKENFENTQLIGAFQSGVTGYYCENVINLDGKINHIALNYSRNRQLTRYIDSIGIVGLIEWKTAFPVGSSDRFNQNWEKLSDDLGDNRTVCFKRFNPIFLNIQH